MIFIRRTLSCLAGLAILASIQPAHAKSDEPDKACQTYFCMLGPQFAQQAVCQPLISDVFNTFSEGTHTVTCGAAANEAAEMTVIRRKADKDYCRPDLKTDKKECRADTAIDFFVQKTLYTRQWKLKSESSDTDTSDKDNPEKGTPETAPPTTGTPAPTPVTAPLTEYYEGKSVPNYELEGVTLPTTKPTRPERPTPPPGGRPRT